MKSQDIWGRKFSSYLVILKGYWLIGRKRVFSFDMPSALSQEMFISEDALLTCIFC